MKILISDNAYIYTATDESSTFFKNMAGKWLSVETKYLFNNQYNTKTYRVMDTQVKAVKDDARAGRGVCQYCGRQLFTGEVCTANKKCAKYGINWFTPENTFFLKYPNGLQQPANELLSIDSDAIKIGTYYLENYPLLDYYRLRNGRQTINFRFDGKQYWIANGIGFKAHKVLPVPVKVQSQLPHYIATLQGRAYNPFATCAP